MTDINTIEKCIAKYGAIEYEQIADADYTAWSRITDLSLFGKVIYFSSKEINKYVIGKKDYDDTIEKLEKIFLKKCKSGEYDIVYCPLGNPNDFTTDPVFIRLYWIVSRKEKERLDLVHNFIRLYYFYAIDADAAGSEKVILNIRRTMNNDWPDRIKHLYREYARGTHGGIRALNERCHTVEILIENAEKNNSGPLHCAI